MKWVLEYSPEQRAYHIQTLAERTKHPVNGYKLLRAFNSESECSDYLYELLKKGKT